LLERTAGSQTLYLYEPGSFTPLALVRSTAPASQPAEASPLPQEWLTLKERYPEQWAAFDLRRQKVLRKLGAEAVPPTSTTVAEIFHFHADHLGTPRELTDESGHVVWSATFRAWGEVATVETPPRRVFVADGNTLRESWEEQTHPVTQNLRFQGQYFDAETGLHYNRFRYYDPVVGRFVGQDPIGLLGGSNNYQYGPNPVVWIDPLGLAGRFGVHKSGHHAPAVRKSVGRPFEMSRSNKCWPTMFPNGADPEHEHGMLHEAERATVGKRQGPFNGTDKELFAAYEKAYADPSLKGVLVDLRSPDGTEMLCADCSPLDAIKKMQEWLRKKGTLCP
jgi:RHS repeat-associated protein